MTRFTWFDLSVAIDELRDETVAVFDVYLRPKSLSVAPSVTAAT